MKASLPEKRPLVIEPPFPKPSSQPEESDVDVFRREMAGVSKIQRDRASSLPQQRTPPLPRPPQNPEAEALAHLSDLVNGTGDFDVTDTTEYVEGAIVGLDARLVRQLRSGNFAVQSHLDLHHLTTDQARASVDRFLSLAQQRGFRCVLIIHGRGLNSPAQMPVLKKWLFNYLARGPWARLVLAFCSARPCDGGTGALYVLLRKQRARKLPIVFTEGAKR